MENVNLKELEELYAPHLSSTTIKQHILDMLANSTQCKAILESINHDTGEYRIVLQGTLKNNNLVSQT
jgi:hypothetical protein